MTLIKTIEELKTVLFRIRSNGKSIGFVPTMGALHKGHVSLLQRARNENEVVVCSIFVNPIQFNNQDDLKKYPRTLDKDVELIKSIADVIFAPEPEEVYPELPTEQFDFGALGSVMEGAYRPGHFNGVATIVSRLFNWIKPDKAYFGEKDYQQLAIIREMVRQKKIPVEIIGCPTVREESGLAVSSRNQRLSDEEKIIAANIYRILQEAKKNSDLPVNNIKELVTSEIGKIKEFKLEYFEIADAKTLQPVSKVTKGNTIACIALYLGEVRLIDEIIL